MKLSELAKVINGEIEAENEIGKIEIKDVNSMADAKTGDVTIFMDTRYKKYLANTMASAIVVKKDSEFEKLCKSYGKICIKVDDVQETLLKLINIFRPVKKYNPFISPLAVIAEGVKLGENVTIHPYVVISANVRIGDNTTIYPFCYIGENCSVGSNTTIYPNVVIYHDCTIGNRNIIHSGAVIGSDGFGYFSRNNEHKKIPQVGKVVIEDDVEIGANVCVVRATLGETLIRKGVKIDNLVQIAHNVKVGENTLIAAQVGISGSCNIGNNVIIAGQAGFVDHLEIGDNAIITPQSGVIENLPKNAVVSGTYAMPHRRWRKVQVILQKLPQLYKQINALTQEVAKLGNNKKTSK